MKTRYMVLLSAIIFSILALLHISRVMLGLRVVIAKIVLPNWISLAIFFVLLVLAFLNWRLYFILERSE